MSPKASEIRMKAKKIQLLLLDVDGVLTDGGIIMDSRGGEAKRFHVQDGHGIRLLQGSGIQVGIISARRSRVVERRARELGVALVRQGVGDKLKVYEEIKSRTGLQDEAIGYIGDDMVDLLVLCRVGLPVAVRDGWEGLRERVAYVTRKRGGNGAVREVAEMLLKAQGKWQAAIRSFVT